MPMNTTAEESEALDIILNCIDCWFKLFHHNYELSCGMYNKAIKNLLKKHQQ